MRVASPEAIARLLLARLEERGERGRTVTLETLVDELLPYERARSALGLAGKGEYDVALLGLLRARDWVEVDPSLLEAVERELRSPEPELASLEELSGAAVRLRDPGRPIERGDREGFSWDEPGGGGVAAVGESALSEPAPESGEDAPAPVESVEPVPAERPSPDEREGGGPPARCRDCGRPRPDRAAGRYCPFCGANQRERRCAACGETLDPAWAYCPACGERQGDARRGAG